MHDIGFIVSDVAPAIMTATKFVYSAAMIFIIFVAGFSIIGAELREYHLTFFFQAGDGIRAGTVTGVQTCALPISATILIPPILLPPPRRAFRRPKRRSA